ncbi:hypothetical protein HK28_03055 [Acetobacter sp. DsW_063]|nr:hypothetical protein HK28_03055 [Acetobacter sp. DsW_063]
MDDLLPISRADLQHEAPVVDVFCYRPTCAAYQQRLLRPFIMTFWNVTTNVLHARDTRAARHKEIAR